jgi:hypothetical protein
LFAAASLAVVLADAQRIAFNRFSAVVLALCAVFLHSSSAPPFPSLSFPTLLLCCPAACIGHGTLSLLYSLLFPFA